MVVDLYSMIMF